MKKLTSLIACAVCVAASAAADPLPPLSDPTQGSQTPASADLNSVIAQANAQTATYNAISAAATAQKAMIDAQSGVTKSQLSGVSAMSGVTPGSVDVSNYQPKSEAMLLVAKATQQAADRLASEIGGSLTDPAYVNRQFVILTGLSELSASDAIQFDTQTAILSAQLASANMECQHAWDATSAAAAAATGGQQRMFLPAVGALLSTGANLASYFQTDYKFGNVDITEPTNLTAAAVAAALRRNKSTQGHSLFIPANVLALDPQPVLQVMNPLQTSYGNLVTSAAKLRARSANLKLKSPDLAASLDAAAAQADKAIANYEAFAAALVKSDAGKPAPVVAVLQQKKLQRDLSAKPLIVLVSNTNVGGFYTKKNMWTFLGGAPLYTMGGVSMTYTVYDPDNGLVLVSGVIPIHGGYESVTQSQKLFLSGK